MKNYMSIAIIIILLRLPPLPTTTNIIIIMNNGNNDEDNLEYLNTPRAVPSHFAIDAQRHWIDSASSFHFSALRRVLLRNMAAATTVKEDEEGKSKQYGYTVDITELTFIESEMHTLLNGSLNDARGNILGAR